MEMKKRNLTVREFINVASYADIVHLSMLVVPLFIVLVLLYQPIREVCTPFLFGAVTAYILLPLVRLISKKLHIPYIVTVVIISFIFLFTLVGLLSRFIYLGNQEIREFIDESNRTSAYMQGIPDWLQSVVSYFVQSTRDISRSQHLQTLPLVESTIARIVYVFAYLVSTFYILKESTMISEEVRNHSLAQKVNTTLQNYFRGQLLLIFVMGTLTWIFLSIIGLKFALLISVFTGFAEIIPYIGPISAAILAMAVALLTGTSVFGNSIVITLLIIASGYFILRQLEDFFVIPLILGRSVKLHPLIILFTTLLAGKLYGLVGLLFGVPFIAIYRIFVEEFFQYGINRAKSAK